MYKLLRGLLFSWSQSDPEIAHELALKALGKVERFSYLEKLLRKRYCVVDPRLEVKIMGLAFPNPVGLAAGFAKNGEAIDGLASLGFGFLELGTVTPLPQIGNPRPRMFRLPKDEGLINRMGFNNLGADALARKLKSRKYSPIPLGISIGKGKDTPLDKALRDYLQCFLRLYKYGDYFVVNVSSPNTKDLRKLQERDHLIDILTSLDSMREAMKRQYNQKKKPILVKVAPDLNREQLEDIVGISSSYCDGIIATNTTIGRDSLKTEINEIGGLSGQPLFAKSLDMVRIIRKLNFSIPIIGVGGISNGRQAHQMLDAGANLIQLYTGLIYQGPSAVKLINQYIREVVSKKDLDSVTELSGQFWIQGSVL